MAGDDAVTVDTLQRVVDQLCEAINDQGRWTADMVETLARLTGGTAEVRASKGLRVVHRNANGDVTAVEDL